MAPLAKLAAVALMIASGVIAAPWDPVSRHTTHRVRSVGPEKAEFQSYHPPATFETFGTDGIDHPLTKRGVKDANSAEAAKAFLESKLGVAPDTIAHKTGSNSDVAEHQYFRQQVVSYLAYTLIDKDCDLLWLLRTVSLLPMLLLMLPSRTTRLYPTVQASLSLVSSMY